MARPRYTAHHSPSKARSVATSFSQPRCHASSSPLAYKVNGHRRQLQLRCKRVITGSAHAAITTATARAYCADDKRYSHFLLGHDAHCRAAGASHTFRLMIKTHKLYCRARASFGSQISISFKRSARPIETLRHAMARHSRKSSTQSMRESITEISMTIYDSAPPRMGLEGFAWRAKPFVAADIHFA